MEKYATNLEEVVEERTAQLQVEKKRTDDLLESMLPKLVWQFSSFINPLFRKNSSWLYLPLTSFNINLPIMYHNLDYDT